MQSIGTQHVGLEALDRFQRNRGDRRGVLAATSTGGNVRQLEELPPNVGPTQCGSNRPLRARWGFSSLALQVEEILQRDLLSGHLPCFRGCSGNLLSLAVYN